MNLQAQVGYSLVKARPVEGGVEYTVTGPQYPRYARGFHQISPGYDRLYHFIRTGKKLQQAMLQPEKNMPDIISLMALMLHIMENDPEQYRPTE